MSDPTLDEFISEMGKFPWSAWTDHPGFEGIYVRRNRVHIDGRTLENVVTITNITSTNPGQGNFTSLVQHILSKGKSIYVECVQNTRFARKLEELGFERVNIQSGIHYFLENKDG